MEIDPSRPGYAEAMSGRAGLALMIYARFCSSVLFFLLALGLFLLVR